MARMVRPEKQVLPDSALTGSVPTHTVSRKQPFYWNKPTRTSGADGYLSKGARVRLVSKPPGAMCVVEDAEGRRVYTLFEGLGPL